MQQWILRRAAGRVREKGMSQKSGDGVRYGAEGPVCPLNGPVDTCAVLLAYRPMRSFVRRPQQCDVSLGSVPPA